jgi:hypothetical protein
VAPEVNGEPAPDGVFDLGDQLIIQRKVLGEEASVPPTPEMLTIPDTTTWSQANAMCQTIGKKLCSRVDICPIELGLPINGMSSSDDWTPVGDSENAWVSIGNYNPDVRLCRTHEDALGVKPSWGTSTSALAFRQRAYCCPE